MGTDDDDYYLRDLDEDLDIDLVLALYLVCCLFKHLMNQSSYKKVSNKNKLSSIAA